MTDVDLTAQARALADEVSRDCDAEGCTPETCTLVRPAAMLRALADALDAERHVRIRVDDERQEMRNAWDRSRTLWAAEVQAALAARDEAQKRVAVLEKAILAAEARGAEAMRERAARLADDSRAGGGFEMFAAGWEGAARNIAAAIRALSTKEDKSDDR